VQTTLFSGSYSGYGLHENAVRSSYQAETHPRKAAL
jgi:predicted NAD/FAD-binding protein